MDNGSSKVSKDGIWRSRDIGHDTSTTSTSDDRGERLTFKKSLAHRHLTT
jgi:hypothetical protein